MQQTQILVNYSDYRRKAFWDALTENILFFFVISAIIGFSSFCIAAPDRVEDYPFKTFFKDYWLQICVYFAIWTALFISMFSFKAINKYHKSKLESELRNAFSALEYWVGKLDYTEDHPATASVYPIEEYKSEISKHMQKISNIKAEMEVIAAFG